MENLNEMNLSELTLNEMVSIDAVVFGEMLLMELATLPVLFIVL